jgi:hypothetical protein
VDRAKKESRPNESTKRKEFARLFERVILYNGAAGVTRAGEGVVARACFLSFEFRFFKKN